MSEVHAASAFGVEKRRGEWSENGDFESDFGRIGIIGIFTWGKIFGVSESSKRLFFSTMVVSLGDEKKEFRREDIMRGEMLSLVIKNALF